ncbi:MAG: hypothetical protein AOA65_0106 [Candidatus Bathyarchaeota archaeon BA1]|nr:MAG: hypothetical protein AOA65_0106 [Candidatus Bathyarchaeota archaeon BA1]
MERKIAVAVFLILCTSPLFMQSIEASRWMGHTIDEKGYHELEMIGNVIPPNSVIANLVHPRFGYWVQYVIRCDIARRLSPDLWRSHSHVLALYQKSSPPKPPPDSKILLMDIGSS